MATSGTPTLQLEWTNLYNHLNLVFNYEGVPTCEPRVRPKSPLLNILLDAISFKFAELEKSGKLNQEDAAPSCEFTSPARSTKDSNSEDVRSAPSEADETTDDEDAFCKSPSVMSHKLKSLSEKKICQLSQLEKSKSAISFQNCPIPQLLIGEPGTQKGTPDSSTRTKEKVPKNPEIVSPASFDSSLSLLQHSKQSTPTSCSINRSSVIKKPVWVDLDEKPKGGNINKNSQLGKRFKQQDLRTMARNLQPPPKNVDVSTRKEYNGGMGSQEVTAKSNLLLNTKGTENDPFSKENQVKPIPRGSGVKRNSDEDAEGIMQRDNQFKFSKHLSQVFFDVSPIKSELKAGSTRYTQDELEQTPPSTQRDFKSNSGKTKEQGTKGSRQGHPLSPISPQNTPDGRRESDEELPSRTPEKANNTFDILKDFDKVPTMDPPTPKFKHKEQTVRKKDERAKLRGWDCEDCRDYYEALESQLDEAEIARIRDRCSKHRSKFAPANNTPENFWNTVYLSTEELYANGHIRVANTPFTPIKRRKSGNDNNPADDMD